MLNGKRCENCHSTDVEYACGCEIIVKCNGCGILIWSHELGEIPQ